jgi:predicted SAM-dependent methyltransferase
MKAKKQVKLHLACGPNVVEGWQNIDILRGKDIINLNLTKPLPYKDKSVDAIFHEHFIEHLTKTEAESFLKECRRVLKPGTVMRIGWPDLNLLLKAYFLRGRKYRDYVLPALDNHRYGTNWDEIFSDCLFSWEHRYAYTARHLKLVLESAGFKNVKVMKRGDSDQDIALDFRNDPATTYIEATR